MVRARNLIGATIVALLCAGAAAGAASADVLPGPVLVADQRFGLVAGDPTADTQVFVTTATALPPPQAGAEVYPRPADGNFAVLGGGFGHGIGMSQYGAHGAGLAGLSYAQILDFYYPGTKLVSQAPATIRVGITVDNDGATSVAIAPGLQVTAAGATVVIPTDKAYNRVRARAGSTVVNDCIVDFSADGGATWSAATAVAGPVTFTNPTTSTIGLQLPAGTRRTYRGTIVGFHIGTMSLATINVVAMQSYLRGVVPSEMPASFHAQALRAQAVAARTYAARGSNGTAFYDTCDTTACQVYSGTLNESATTDSAVADTAGQVLTYLFSDGVTRLATTMFSSSNGGWEAPGGAGHGYLAAHADPYDAVSNNSRARWTAVLPASSLESRYGIASVQRVQILSRDGAGEWGGRVLTVLVEGFTSAGDYAYANATGAGLQAAQPWPTNSTGLSSTYFTIIPPATPTGPEDYHPITPARVLDTRPTGVTVDGLAQPKAPIGPGASITVPIAGRAGVPASGVAAVAVNLTGIGPTASTYLSLYPSGITRPGTSTLNLAARAIKANSTLVRLGATGAVEVFNAVGSTDVALDVVGYFPMGGSYVALDPARFMDTRGLGTVDGQGPLGALGQGGVATLQIGGRDAIPTTGVAAVVLNLTGIAPTRGTYVIGYPSGEAQPMASTINLPPGVVVPGQLVGKLGATGAVDFANALGSIDLAADVQGYIPAGAGNYHALSPTRILDTRPGAPRSPVTATPGQPIGANAAINVSTAFAGIPSGAHAVVVNITGIEPSAGTYLAAYASGTTRPNASTLNLNPGEVRANLAMVPVGQGGTFALYNAVGSTHVAVDIVGYFG